MKLLPFASVVSLILGIGVGAVIRSCPPATRPDWLVDLFDGVGAMWVDAIRMTVVPLIVPLLIGAIAGATDGRAAARLSLTTTAAFLGLVVLLSVLATLAAPTLFSRLTVDAALPEQLRGSIGTFRPPTRPIGPSDVFRSLIPTNPVRAFADGDMPSIVFFTIAFGFAALATPPDVRLPVLRFTQACGTIMLVLVRAVLMLAPVGVFALSVVIGMKVGGVALMALGYFLVVDAVLVLLFLVALFWLTLARSGLSAARIVRGAAPALTVAASTSSSLCALPAMIEGVRREWRLPQHVYGFILPFAVATFKPTSAFSWVIASYFVAKIFLIPFDESSLVLAAGYTVLFNAVIPGIPGGGIVVASSMFLAIGLPIEGLAVLLAMNPILDRFATVGNVAADLAMTAALAGRTRATDTEPAERDMR